MSLNFEQLFKLAQSLPIPKNDGEREVSWCDSRQILGISRQHGGGYEIFLCGDELKASIPAVQRHMKFDQWSRAHDQVFKANRLVLPAEEHFLPIAVLLAEEFLRQGVSPSLAAAFAKTEPLVEMALRRIALGEEEILGLLGELRLLEVLFSMAGDSIEKRALALDCWRGHERGSRDFLRGSRSVEVKATRGRRSVHRISNVFQVDPRRGPADELQEDLYLLSLGFDHDDSSSAHVAMTLPTQVDRLLQKLSSGEGEPTELQALLLAKIASYGGTPGAGYDHNTMRGWSAYQVGWQHTFVRVYDMGDAAVQTLRRQDLQQRPHVVLSSCSFEIDLPERISGDINPHGDLMALARFLVAD
jgi:hypothetical protein